MTVLRKKRLCSLCFTNHTTGTYCLKCVPKAYEKETAPSLAQLRRAEFITRMNGVHYENEPRIWM